jgi:hypothetical protein
MLAYHLIEEINEKRKLEAGAVECNDEKLEMSAYLLLEKIIKRYKLHRGATNFDSAYDVF